MGRKENCIYIYKRGNKKGKQCAMSCINKYCHNHKPSKLGSKINKKNKCKHVFIRGNKSGQKCNISCRGEYCNKHNLKTKTYKAKWFQKKKQYNKLKELEQKIQKIKGIKSYKDLPNLHDEIIKKRKLLDKAGHLIKKIVGVKIVLGDNCDDYINEKRKQSIHKPYFPFKGNKKQAQKKYEILMKKRIKLIEKIKQQNLIMKKIEEKQKIFEELNNSEQILTEI